MSSTLINKTINFFSGEYLTFNNFIDHIFRIKKKKFLEFISRFLLLIF